MKSFNLIIWLTTAVVVDGKTASTSKGSKITVMDEITMDQSDPRKFSTEVANFIAKMNRTFGSYFFGIIIFLCITGIALAIMLYAWRYSKNHRHPLIESLKTQQTDQNDAAFRSRFFKVDTPRSTFHATLLASVWQESKLRRRYLPKL